MTRLREQLKVALSGKVTADGEEQGPSTAELSERIKAIRAGLAVEAALSRLKPQRPEAAKPRRRIEEPESPKQE